MNKSILIVVCDFLIISILSLVDFDSGKAEQAAQEEQIAVEAVENFSDAQLVDLLKMSLDKEREKRMELDKDISRLSESVESTKAQSERRKKLLEAREMEISQLAKTKESLEREKESIQKKAKDLETRVTDIDKKNALLNEEIISATKRLEKSNLERIELERKLGDMRQTDTASQAKLKLLQEELKRNKDHLENLKAESEKLKDENRAMELEKQALATRLEVASTKSQIYAENLKRTQALVDIEKAEKRTIQHHANVLAEGVGELAQSQEKIAKNVAQLRAKTASEVFADVKGNLVWINITSSSKGLFGSSVSNDEIRAPIVEFGGRLYALFDSYSTVLRPMLNRPAIPPETLSVSVISDGNLKITPERILALKEDPRILAVEIPHSYASRISKKPLKLSENPYKFSESVLVEPTRLYYGQIPFKVDFGYADYANMDVGLFESLFGEFAPSEGDVMMSRGGEFLGFAVNSSYAVVFRNITTLSELKTGKGYTKVNFTLFMASAAERLRSYPIKLK